MSADSAEASPPTMVSADIMEAIEKALSLVAVEDPVLASSLLASCGVRCVVAEEDMDPDVYPDEYPDASNPDSASTDSGLGDGDDGGGRQQAISIQTYTIYLSSQKMYSL